MKNKSITSIFVLMLAVFNSFANQVPQQGKHAAILPFTVKGEFDALYAEAVQDKFTAEVMKSNQYVVISQSQLDKAMKEANFTAENYNEDMAIKVGELSGAEIVIMVKITSLRGTILMNTRAIDTATGSVVFAESDSAISNDVLALAEKTARKFSGIESFGQNDIYFSASDSLDTASLKESERIFVVKKLQRQWAVDPNNAEQVSYVYKKYLTAGIVLCAVGGTLTTASIPLIAVGSYMISVLSSEYYRYYSDKDYIYGAYGKDIGVALLSFGIIAAFTCIMLPISAYPFVTAHRIKNIYKKLHNGQSFNIKPSFSSVYDPKQKQDRMQIALSLQF
ncbi:MAG: hypothetical protein J1G30_09815 [Spirochaetales bacterium]|nr:hypothetical protein [Spirochaetales bacterium]